MWSQESNKIEYKGKHAPMFGEPDNDVVSCSTLVCILGLCACALNKSVLLWGCDTQNGAKL